MVDVAEPHAGIPPQTIPGEEEIRFIDSNLDDNNFTKDEQQQQQEDESTNLKLQQLALIGSGVVSYLGKQNPLQGIHSMAEATAKMRREAKDLVNPTAFSKPKDRSEWMTRVNANFGHFRLSYSTCYALTTVYFVLTSPFLLFELGLLFGLWALFFKINNADDVVTVGQYKLGRKEKMMVLVPSALFVVFFGGLLSSFMYILFVGSVFVGAHASFRQPVEPDPLEEFEKATPTSEVPQFV